MNFLAEIQKIRVYRSYSEQYWDEFLEQNPEFILWVLGAFVVILLVCLFFGRNRR